MARRFNATKSALIRKVEEKYLENDEESEVVDDLNPPFRAPPSCFFGPSKRAGRNPRLCPNHLMRQQHSEPDWFRPYNSGTDVQQYPSMSSGQTPLMTRTTQCGSLAPLALALVISGCLICDSKKHILPLMAYTHDASPKGIPEVPARHQRKETRTHKFTKRGLAARYDTNRPKTTSDYTTMSGACQTKINRVPESSRTTQSRSKPKS